jgi:UDP-glucose 4-epimerase
MSVLITGGTGVIGSHVARQLVAAGTNVVITTARGDTSLVSDIADSIVIRRCDVRDQETHVRLIAENRVDRVIHLAALLPDACLADPVQAGGRRVISPNCVLPMDPLTSADFTSNC